MRNVEIKFTDSMQVEESFYQAFRYRNMDLMKQVWDKTDEVICIHPGSPRIYSFDLIIASWEQIFSADQSATIEISEPVYKLGENICIHYVKEILIINKKTMGSVYATNIYHQSSEGWKMIAHHASPTFVDSEVSSKPSLH